MIKAKTDEIKSEIVWKRKYFKYLQVVYGILSKFYSRNRETKTEEKAINLPLVTLMDEDVRIEVIDGVGVRVLSLESRVKPETEMQALARLFPEK